jgi:hypothetical protein
VNIPFGGGKAPAVQEKKKTFGTGEYKPTGLKHLVTNSNKKVADPSKINGQYMQSFKKTTKPGHYVSPYSNKPLQK